MKHCGYGVPVVVTPLSIMKELPVTENEAIVLNYDCSNVDEVARQIFEKPVEPFEYTPPKDNWDKLLVRSKSTYQKEMKQKTKVKAKIPFTDVEENIKRRKDEIWTTNKARAQYLKEINFIEIINE